MKAEQLKPVIEAVLMVSDQPLSVEQLSELFDDYERPAKGLLRDLLQQLAVDYQGRGIELIEVASGWRIQARKEYASRIARLWTERPQKYSRALLETLALIAYRQPVTRGDIEEIRGVSVSSSIMKTLVEREWVRVVGHRDVPGRPAMYATTRHFLDYFNLKALDQLPTLNEIRELGEQMQAEQQQAIADDEARMLASQEEKRRQMMAEAQAEHDAAASDTDDTAAGISSGATEDPDDDETGDEAEVDLDNLPEVLTFSELSQRFDERLEQKQAEAVAKEQALQETTDSVQTFETGTSDTSDRQNVSPRPWPPIPDSE